ncbi:MAG: FAD-dependent monooxygenase [Myxococcales bacterium]|nr:FAD-dependent monooxygenase [Myxococcales bacterium]
MRPEQAGTVHVIGGGIGGLAVAGGLHARGFDVHVHEQAPSFAHVGGGHWLYANALRALDRLGPGLAAEMSARGHGFDGFHFATPGLRTLLLESTAPYTPSPELAPVVLHRADIIDVLRARVPAERLHFGRRLEEVRPDGLQFSVKAAGPTRKSPYDQKLVIRWNQRGNLPRGVGPAVDRFADGTELRPDLLLGADGIHSRVRPVISERRPSFSGQTGLWGIADLVLPEAFGRHFTELWSDGLRMGFTTVGGGGLRRVYWFMVVREEVPDGDDARKAFVLERATAFPAELVEAVERTPAAGIATNPLWDMSPPRRWHDDTVCCLGDAVHPCTPNLGQGGCQALEDAACLAECFVSEATPALAYAAFQRRRWWRTFAVVHLSRNLGRLAQSRGFAARLRDLVVGGSPSWAPRPVLWWISS